MLKVLLVAVATLISSVAFAQKQQIEVISRFDAHITTAVVANELLRIVNKMQDQFEFRMSAVPGAGGEPADRRAITLARSGQPTLVLGSSSTWAFNRYVFGNTFDRDKDIVPIIGMGGIPFAVQVNPDLGIDTVDQLVDRIRNKKEAFHATTSASSASRLFADLFIDHYKLNNVKHISYRLSSDMIRGVLGKEADFTIYNYADSAALKVIAVSSIDRSPLFPNAPTGKEIGFPDFRYNTIATLSTPKESLIHFAKIAPIFIDACKTVEMKTIFDKAKMMQFCYNTEKSMTRINDEIQLLKKYENVIYTNLGPSVQTTRDLRVP
jgi:tripartite-type tricarboxylate transporter receptor subunit TctC